MTAGQTVRLALAAFVVAAIQSAAFDRFLLLDSAHLILPVWLLIGVAGRIPATNAAVIGFGIGCAWDLMVVDLFGRYAFALAVIGLFASLVVDPNRGHTFRVRTGRRALVLGLSTLWLWSISAVVGEVLPPMTSQTGIGLVLAVAIGLPYCRPTGFLARLALPGRTEWEYQQNKTSRAASRRGLYVAGSSHESHGDDDSLIAA